MKTRSNSPILPSQDLGNGSWYVHLNIELVEKPEGGGGMMQPGPEKYYQADTVMIREMTVSAVADAIFRDKYPYLEEVSLLKCYKESGLDDQSEAGVAYNACQSYKDTAREIAREVLK